MREDEMDGPMPATEEGRRELLEKWRRLLFDNASVHYKYASFLNGRERLFQALNIFLSVSIFAFSVSNISGLLASTGNSGIWSVLQSPATATFGLFVGSIVYATTSTFAMVFSGTEKFFHHKVAATQCSALRRKMEEMMACKPIEPGDLKYVRKAYNSIVDSAPLIPKRKYNAYKKSARIEWERLTNQELAKRMRIFVWIEEIFVREYPHSEKTKRAKKKAG
ncbi:MAG: hypothetical protein R3B98_00135 [Hyphomonas sp.]